MKHFRYKTNCRRLIRILFRKYKCEFECAVFKRCVMRSERDKKLYVNDVSRLSILTQARSTNPKITAFQSIILLSVGAPLTPTGGSSWSLKSRNNRQAFSWLFESKKRLARLNYLLKSLIKRRLAGVDIIMSDYLNWIKCDRRIVGKINTNLAIEFLNRTMNFSLSNLWV